MAKKKQKLIYKYRLSSMIWSVLTTAVIVALVSLIIASAVNREPMADQAHPDQQNQNESAADSETVPETSTALASGSYFILSAEDGSKTALNLSTRDSRVLPDLAGYSIRNTEDIVPEYLIVEKDNQLFSFDVKQQKLNSAAIIGIGEFELVNATSSISAKDKFLLEVYKYREDVYQSGMAWELSYDDVDTYIYDAGQNKLSPIRDAEYGACHMLDSANNRYFVWSCGEGVGESLPLFTINLTSGERREIITSQAFHTNVINARLLDSTYRLSYFNGYFVSTAFSKDAITGFAVVDAKSPDASVRQYDFTPEAMNQFKALPISPTQRYLFNDRDGNIIVIDDNNLSLLRSTDGHISAANQISSQNIYPVPIYLNDKYLYFLNLESGQTQINIFNLESGQVESMIAVGSVIGAGFWSL